MLCLPVNLYVFATWYACLVDFSIVRAEADVALGLAFGKPTVAITGEYY